MYSVADRSEFLLSREPQNPGIRASTGNRDNFGGQQPFECSTAVELDLHRYKGNILIEMFGKEYLPASG